MHCSKIHSTTLIAKISAAELSTASELEPQLTTILQNASTWKALLLFDEADVLLQKRSHLTLERNRLVAVFLRKLEYFDGILFLTTNLMDQFNDAILSRIHLQVDYEKLSRDARKTIIVQFAARAHTDEGPPNLSQDDLNRLAEAPLNGREVSNMEDKFENSAHRHVFQIKNVFAIARTLATAYRVPLSTDHVSQALELNSSSKSKAPSFYA